MLADFRWTTWRYTAEDVRVSPHNSNILQNTWQILIIGFCILLRVILTVNNNTFCFATIDHIRNDYTSIDAYIDK
jgi:hypothetical protein